MVFLFQSDQTFRVPHSHYLITINGGQLYTWELMPVKLITKVEWLFSYYINEMHEGREWGYDGPVKFYYRGIRLYGFESLGEFYNVQDGDEIYLVMKINIAFEYRGRLDTAIYVTDFFNNWSNTNLTLWVNAFIQDYTRRTGREDKTFDFSLMMKNLMIYG